MFRITATITKEYIAKCLLLHLTIYPARRVSVVYENYVVIIQLSKKHDGTLKGHFKTAYVADNSIGKIRNSPKWNISMMT